MAPETTAPLRSHDQLVAAEAATLTNPAGRPFANVDVAGDGIFQIAERLNE